MSYICPVTRRLLVLLLLGLPACATQVGPEGLAVGAPCMEELDCASGSYCLVGRGFPEGTCTTSCREDADCRGGSRCVEQEAGVCLLPCRVDEDCARQGYVCRDRVSRGVVGSARVCVGR